MNHRPSKRITIFIALEIPEEIRYKLGLVQEQLNKLNLPVIWEKPEKLHITLAYLGKINETEYTTALRSLRVIASQFNRFNINVGYLNYFFKHEGYGTIWVGVDSQGVLENFHKELTRNLNQKGFSLSEKKIVPHISLGKLKKVRKSMKMQFLDQLTDYQTAENVGEFIVGRAVVMTSHYRRTFNTTEYQIVDAANLGE